MIDKEIYDNYIATHRDFLFNAIDYFKDVIAKDDVDESLCFNDVEFKVNEVVFIYEDVDKSETYRKSISMKEFLDFANNNYQDGEVSERYINEDDVDDFFDDEKITKELEGKCFINRKIGVAVKILYVPTEGSREFVYERLDNTVFGWSFEDYIWLQEQSEPEYEALKLTPYANLNIASENMFLLGNNGKLYTTVDCGDLWYEYVELSTEKFEKYRREAMNNE